MLFWRKQYFDRQSIITNTWTLGKRYEGVRVPVILTTLETKSFSGKCGRSSRGIPGRSRSRRSSMNSWDDRTASRQSRKPRRKLFGRPLETEVVRVSHGQAIQGRLRNLRLEDAAATMSHFAQEDNAMKVSFKPAQSRSPQCRSCWMAARLGSEGEPMTQSGNIVRTHIGALVLGSNTLYTMVMVCGKDSLPKCSSSGPRSYK